MTSSSWQRPVPTIGDATSSVDRRESPDGWRMGEDVVRHLDEVIGARRDIRRYRDAAVPADLVHEVIDAGHHGPSVGHSQPWRFIVIDDPAVRDRAALMADRERLRQADLLTADRRARLLDLQLEGIREAPLGIVVACDRRTPASGVLGRNTFTDADLWSCAAAIENMWLAARARGLGMGWVTLFDPAELAGLLHLPDGVETLGWMCLGWPDERPPAPGLERRGWSRRLPVDSLIMTNRWPDAAEPASPVSGLPTPAATSSAVPRIIAPDQRHVVDAHDGADRLLTPPGSLGKLDQVLDRLIAAAGDEISTGTLVLAGADHPVRAHGVSAFDGSVTAEVMAASVAGTALGVATAESVGLGRIVVDAGVDTPVPGAIDARAQGERGDLVTTDAMSAAQVDAAIERGIAIAVDLADDNTSDLEGHAGRRGLVCLGEVGVANTTVAAALACALTGMDPAETVGLGASSDSVMVERKVDVVSRALARAASTHDDLADPRTALAAVGGPELAVLTGVVLGAASVGRPVVLDGLATSVAALAAVRSDPAVQSWLVAGQVSREHAHAAVLRELGLEPLLDLRLRAGEGVGACQAAGLILTALDVRRRAARWA